MDPDFNFRKKVDYQKLLGSLLYKSTIQYITCVLKLHGSPDLGRRGLVYAHFR